MPPVALDRVDQDVAVRRQRRLHDRAAFPRVLPEHRAVSRRDARRAGALSSRTCATPSIVTSCGEL